MPQLTIYHLSFPHGLHIGAGGVESLEDTLETIPSDTLFAALLDTWRHLGRDVKEILPEAGAPAFRVTSAFPFAGGVRFYPKPVDLRQLFSPGRIKDFGAGKNIKKIRYLSEKLLERARQGATLDDELEKDSDDEWACKFSLQGGAFWLTKDEMRQLPENMWFYTEKINGIEQKKERPTEAVMRQKVFETQTAPRVTVDRVSSASNLFQSERVLFNEGCGLWLGVAQTSSLQPGTLDELLAVLGDSGLGGERTAGYGHFTYEQRGALEFDAPQACAYLLSRWHPAKGETALLTNSAYKLEAVQGWLRAPGNAAQRRKRVWMVAESSLIAGNPQGDAVDVRPEYDAKSGETIEHPVYRPGFALALDWNWKDWKRKVTHE